MISDGLAVNPGAVSGSCNIRQNCAYSLSVLSKRQ